MEYQDGLAEARQLRRKLEDTHMKMQKNLKSKLSKYLEPILEVPSADKNHWWFPLMIDPHYVNELIDARKLNEIETVDTRTITNEIMPKFYYYILAE